MAKRSGREITLNMKGFWERLVDFSLLDQENLVIIQQIRCLFTSIEEYYLQQHSWVTNIQYWSRIYESIKFRGLTHQGYHMLRPMRAAVFLGPIAVLAGLFRLVYYSSENRSY